MSKLDSVQRFIFEHASIRGEMVHIESTYQIIMSQRDYPPMVKHLLGEALVACLLLANTIKFEGSLNLQFQGDKRLPLLLVQCDHALRVRAFAQFAEGCTTEDYASAFVNGRLVLVISQNNKTQTYESSVPIQSTSMAENLMTYFAQSEQIPTKVWLAASDEKAAGMLLQLMPGQDSLQREQFWEYAVHLGQTITEEELLTLDNEVLLHRLYHETEIRIFESRMTCFQCRCTQEKMKQVIAMLGEQEAKSILDEQKAVTIHCDFCNKQYSFDSIDVTLLFKK